MNIAISFTKFLAENWKRTHCCIKILLVGILIQALLVTMCYYTIYLYINSGSLNTLGRAGVFLLFGAVGITLCLYLFAVICLILSFFKTPRMINLILSIIAISFIYSIDSVCYGDKISQFFGQPNTDIVRYYAHNIQAVENLEKFSKQIILLKANNDFVFTEQSVNDLVNSSHFEQERYHFIFDPDFDFNKNLLGLKPSQFNKNTVVLFQSKNDSSSFADANDISADWHYGRGSLIVLGDGRIEFVKAEDFNNLRWQP